jgi:ABC-type iron transport system FetAB ATPase subunit
MEDTAFDELRAEVEEQIASIAQLLDSEDVDELEQITSAIDEQDSDEDEEVMLHYKPT